MFSGRLFRSESLCSGFSEKSLHIYENTGRHVPKVRIILDLNTLRPSTVTINFTTCIYTKRLR
jgi:hypothetical protein